MTDYPWRLYLIVHKDIVSAARDKMEQIFGGDAVQRKAFGALRLSRNGQLPVEAYACNIQVSRHHRDEWEEAFALINDHRQARYYGVDWDTRVLRVTNSPTAAVGEPLTFYQALEDAGAKVINME